MQLSFEDISISYEIEDAKKNTAEESSLAVLEHVSLDVASGESVAIIGPSGCGKSTLLRLAAGLIFPDSGRILLDGCPVDAPHREVALILQDFGLLPWKNVYHNAELGLRIRKVDRATREQRVKQALEHVGLSGFEKNYPRELSGGMQQRLALARVLALDTHVLLMDEPLSAIDELLREDLQNLLLDLWLEEKRTQLIVTHSIEEAVFLGQRIVVMSPRPARIVAEVDNPNMGTRAWRQDAAFFEQCTRVRALLANGGELYE